MSTHLDCSLNVCGLLTLPKQKELLRILPRTSSIVDSLDDLRDGHNNQDPLSFDFEYIDEGELCQDMIDEMAALNVPYFWDAFGHDQVGPFRTIWDPKSQKAQTFLFDANRNPWIPASALKANNLPHYERFLHLNEVLPKTPALISDTAHGTLSTIQNLPEEQKEFFV